MYTTDDLVKDCVGQFIENQPHSINRASLLNDRQYCEVWTSLLQWTEKQIKRKNSFIIPHFGLIKYIKTNAHSTHDFPSNKTRFTGNKNTNHATKAPANNANSKWKFYIQPSYIHEQNATIGSHSDIHLTSNLNHSSAIKCHISSLSKYSSSLSDSQLRVGLQHLFTKLSQQIGRSATSTKNYHDIDHFKPHLKILINFGWGYLLCADGVIDFIFTKHESLIIRPNIPNGLKRIPKQYLASTASLLSQTSIPSNVKITDVSQTNPLAKMAAQLQRYKEKYTLPIDDAYENPLIALSSRHTIPESFHDKSEFPRVLSEFSRTLGSTYCTHTNYEAPSSKIGLFYTPTSSLYRINTEQKRIEYTDYLPFFQAKPEKYYKANAKKILRYQLTYKVKHANDSEHKNEEIAALDLEIASSCTRYHEYIHHRMDDEFIAPLTDDVIATILNKLEPDLSLISQEKVEQILEENLQRIQTQHVIAIKQAILDYVLRNNAERARLNIKVPPHHIPEWGFAPLPFSAPLSWGNRLHKSWNAINESSYFVNRGIIEMLSLWQNYKDYRLFGQPLALKRENDDLNVPVFNRTESERSVDHEPMQKRSHFTMPMSIQEFHEQQEEHLEYVRNIFINNWYNDSVAIMKTYVEENALDSSESSTLKLFSAIAAFMSRGLCEIVYESLKDCVAFFERYANAPVAVYNTNVLDIEAVPLSAAPEIQPLWRIGIEYGKDGMEYEIPLEEIDIAISDMIESIITCFEGISCVEGKIFGLLENVPNLCVYVDNDIKKKTRQSILGITSAFVTELHQLQDLYSSEYAPLCNASEDLNERLMEIEMDEDMDQKMAALSAFKEEIQKYEIIRENVANKAHLRLRMGLFEVECRAINALIINHCVDLKNGITNHVATRLMTTAQKMVVHCEEKSKRLLKKPETAQELVDLANEIELFEKSELEDWQTVSHDIGEELTFLFETDHPLSHDLLRSVGRVSDWNKKIIQHKAVADQNCITQRQFIETTVMERGKQFEVKIKKMYQEVEDLKLLSEIRDTSQIERLKENMKCVDGEKVWLSVQQKLLHMDLSEFKIYRLLHDAVEKL